ncbi:MAG: DsrE family protein, partial [Planctomycetales bacterium]|nr:DsrE family protein [Planctomycetales bacterium]
KVVLDVTSGERTGGVLKGLDKAALILNLYSDAKAGVDQGFKMVIVLHGSATSAALRDEAFARRDLKPSSTTEKTDHNPDAKLIGELRKAGVQIVVCGQSLARNGYPVDEVMSEVEVAVSATVTSITLQNQDYAYLPFH